MSGRRVGGYEYNAELVRIRNAANDILQALQQMLEGTLSAQVIVAYAVKMIRQVGIILDAIGKLEGFGEKAKIERTSR